MTIRLQAALMTVLLLSGVATAAAQAPDVQAEHTSQSVKAPAPAASQNGFHDLICKPSGSEDSFDCADEATPAKIVPIPSQVLDPRPQDRLVIG